MFALPIFPGRPGIATGAQRRKSPGGILPLNDSPVDCFSHNYYGYKEKEPSRSLVLKCSRYLSSRVGQVLSLRKKHAGGMF